MRTEQDSTVFERRRVMAVLARSDGRDIEVRIGALSDLPSCREIRRPEIGLVMLRGRIGGSGAPFNLGEATVTRAAVQLPTGETGFCYALGRDAEKARNSAIVDALWQSPEWRARVEAEIVEPLTKALAESDARSSAATATTRVDFFTLVRGED